MLVACCAGVLVLAGCGTDGSAADGGTSSAAASASTRTGEDRATRIGTSGGDTNGPAADGSDATAASRALEQRFTALEQAYAPVTGRVSFLVAAETLRADAVDAGAGADVVAERAGSVRVEIRRLASVLARAHAAVRARRVSTGSIDADVRLLMLRAIDQRQLALRRLDSLLDAAAATTGAVDPALTERWRAAWDGSVRAAREATTRMQDARAEAGLPAGREDAVR